MFWYTVDLLVSLDPEPLLNPKFLFFLRINWSKRYASTTLVIDFYLPSYAPDTILLLSNRIHLTSSSWPSSVLRHVPCSISQIRIELSDDPETTIFSRYCKQAEHYLEFVRKVIVIVISNSPMPRLWPWSVRTNSQEVAVHTLIVLSPEADTMYLSSKSTTFTAARCPKSPFLITISEQIFTKKDKNMRTYHLDHMVRSYPKRQLNDLWNTWP